MNELAMSLVVCGSFLADILKDLNYPLNKCQIGPTPSDSVCSS